MFFYTTPLSFKILLILALLLACYTIVKSKTPHKEVVING